MITVFVVLQDTSGAHEPAGAWSIWTSLKRAKAEAARLDLAYNVHPLYHRTRGEIATRSQPLGNGGFYVRAVDTDLPSNEAIE